MPDIYLIDGIAVNAREDWRDVPPVSATGPARQEAFPGSGITYTLTPTKRGSQIVIEGFLEGSSSTTLRAKVAAADDLRFDIETHTVEILGTTYTECQLVQPLGVLGLPQARVKGGSNILVQRVRYVWQQLNAEGGSS